MANSRRSVARLTLLLTLGLFASLPFAARAVDGTIEINQVRATQGGINGDFATDPAGFPVVITESGSYRLTGNLSVTQATETGILIAADHVTIDLNGFGVIGPGIPGSGHGVASNVMNPFCCGDFATVMNGFVRDAAGAGILLNDDARVERMTIDRSSQSGIRVNRRGIVLGNRVVDSQSFGLELGATTGYANNSVSGSALPSVTGGLAIGGNICDDGRCSAVPKRRYYLTQTGTDGINALGHCAEGYHMASIFEIDDPSSLQYETVLGATRPDAGEGPPIVAGWVRTGTLSGVLAVVGSANCDAWTSRGAGDSGSVIQLDGGWDNASSSDIPPWEAATALCSTLQAVWCVED